MKYAEYLQCVLTHHQSTAWDEIIVPIQRFFPGTVTLFRVEVGCSGAASDTIPSVDTTECQVTGHACGPGRKDVRFFN